MLVVPPVIEYIDGLKSTASLGLHEFKSHMSSTLEGHSEIIRESSFTDGPKSDWSLLLRSPSTLMVKLQSHRLTLGKEYFP